MDAFLKELGVGMAKRMIAKGLKPRLVISENGGKWTIRSETSLKTKSVEFTPDVEFEETTADGREVKVCSFVCQFYNLLSTCVFRRSFDSKTVHGNT
jgi:hypothetical protein